MSPIGLAVVGAGYWGPNLVRAARATPALRLHWLCDLDLQRAQAVLDPYPPVRATSDYEAVLADPAIAAVAIATPAATHFDLVRAALGAGEHGLVAQPQTALGAARACLAYLSIWMSTGVLAHVNVNWLSPTKIRTTVFGGTKRTIVWDDMNPPARLMIHDRGVDRLESSAVGQDERRQTLISYRTGDISVPALPEREALPVVMAEFASPITEGRPPLTDAGAGLRVLAVLEAASLSVERDGARVPVTLGGSK